MSKTIYVGNLPFSATNQDVEALFQPHGTVDSVDVIMDRETGRARGFAFVEMSDAQADTAIRAVDGTELEGRPLRVSEKRDGGNRR